MTSFPDRERGFEAKFAHDEELGFKAAARRDGLTAHWAAQKLGLAGAGEREYVTKLLSADLERPGTDVVFEMLRKDFDAAGVNESDQRIRHVMDEFFAQAIAQIKAGI